MTKSMFLFRVLFADNKVRSYKVCGSTLDIAIQQFMKEFPKVIIVSHEFLYEYED